MYKLKKFVLVFLFSHSWFYCQGLSFLAAALLLQMKAPESFALLVKIMFNYHMRDMFQNGFYHLQACFYKLDIATCEFLPDIHEHFVDIGCEPHMYGVFWEKMKFYCVCIGGVFVFANIYWLKLKMMFDWKICTRTLLLTLS